LTAQIIHFPSERVLEAEARPTVEESRAYLDKLLRELKAAQSERKELERSIRSLTMRARHAVERLKRQRLRKPR
jgi:predicted transcriptional regulator